MTSRKSLGFELLESRVVLSPTPADVPTEVDESTLMIQIEREIYVKLEEEMAEAERLLLQDITNGLLRDAIEAERKATDQEIRDALAPMPAPTPDPGYWESFMNAVDEAIKAATEAHIPLYHP